MGLLVKFENDISRIELKSLLWFSFEVYFVASFHSLFNLEFQVSWLHCYLLATADRAFVSACEATSFAFFTLHFYFLHFILHLNLPQHLSCAWTYRAFMHSATGIACSFAMLTDLSPSKAINLVASGVKLFQRYRHLSPKIPSFVFGLLLKFFQSLFSIQIICNPLRHINKNLIGSFDFNIFFLHFLIARITIWMVLDGQFPKRFFQLITRGVLIHVKKFIQLGLPLTNCQQRK